MSKSSLASRYDADDFYPESDGEPIAETDTHAQLMIDLRHALAQRFQSEADVYVSGNLFIYYVRGNNKLRVAPDVFLVRGVSKAQRRSYKLWQEKHSPLVVFEISSKDTWRQDMYEKWRLYEKLGVQEYFLFDPEYDYLPEPLIGWQLVKKHYEPLTIQNKTIVSGALGLELVDTGQTLRLRDPKTGMFLPTPAEEAQAREQAENRATTAETKAQKEATARRKAEAEVERLRREIERLRRQS